MNKPDKLRHIIASISASRYEFFNESGLSQMFDNDVDLINDKFDELVLLMKQATAMEPIR